VTCCICSDLWQGLRHRIRERPVFCTLAFLSWLLWLFLSRNVPYGIDDWQWGVSAGLEHLKTADLNSRYAGNMLEVIVSRSVVFKTLLMGTMEALIPMFSVLLVGRWRETERNAAVDDRFLSLLLILANLVFLTLPLEVWQQTYGWVAGFSNYGFAAFLLVISQGILLDGKNLEKKHSAGYLLLCVLIGFIAQLVLESLTVFLFPLTLLLVLAQLFACRRCSAVSVAFLVGAALGATLMFSGRVYSTLLVTGHTEGVGRQLSFTPDMSLPDILRIFYYRFWYFMPGNLWGNNWLACTVIALCMIPASKGFGRFLRAAVTGICCCFALFFVLGHFCGPIEKYISRWNEFYTQWLHILFFLFILVLVFFLFRKQKKLRAALLLLWLLCPLAISPMLAVTDMGGRCFLPPIVFLAEFCLLLFGCEAKELHPPVRKTAVAFLSIVFLISCARMTAVFSRLGKAERQRETLIAGAREARVSSLYLPDYPYEAYHWITEPLKGGGQIQYFREFYQIPDEMELLFDPVE